MSNPAPKPNRIVTINGTPVLLDTHGKLNVTTTYGKSAKLYEIFTDEEILISLNSMGESVIPLRKNGNYVIRYFNQFKGYNNIESDESMVEKIKNSGSEVIGSVINNVYNLTLIPVNTAKKAYSTAYNVADYSQNIAKKSVKKAVTVIPYGNYFYGRLSNLKHSIFDSKQNQSNNSNINELPDEFGSREFLYDTKALTARKAYLEQEYIGEKSPTTKINIKNELFSITPKDIENIKKNAINNKPTPATNRSNGYLNNIASYIKSPFLGFLTPQNSSKSFDQVDDDEKDPFAYRKKLYD